MGLTITLGDSGWINGTTDPSQDLDDDDIHSWSCGYSNFHRLRVALADLYFGENSELAILYRLENCTNEQKQRLLELLAELNQPERAFFAHSDNQGFWDPIDCAQIYSQFSGYLDELPEGDLRERFKQLLELLRTADTHEMTAYFG